LNALTRSKRGKARAHPSSAVPAGGSPTTPTKASGLRSWRVAALAVTLALTTFAAYSPVLENGFVNYDDDHYLTDNPQLRLGLSWEGVVWAATTTFGANWFPLTWLSWLLDYEIYGLSPRGFHLTSLILHVASAVLLFLVFLRMTAAPGKSAFVAAVFALHPLHVESVAWAATRKDVLSGLFFMLTLWAYVRYTKRSTIGRYLPVPLFLALGLMAKPMLVTMPFLLLLLDAWPLGRLRADTLRRLLIEKTPLFVLVAASSMITYWAQQASGAVQALERFSLPVRMGNALIVYWAYLGKTIWPAGLAVYYPHPGSSVTVGGTLVAGAGLLAASLVALRAARARPYLPVGWFWYLGSLVPVIGLVQVGQQAMADRYTYLPLIGISALLAWTAAAAVAGAPSGRRLLAGGAALALAGCAIVTFQQAGRWRDSVTLFQHALRVTSENALAHINLGVALLNLGRLDPAAAELREAIRIHPGSAEAHAALGQVRSRQGQAQEAAEHFTTALRLDPASARTHRGYGAFLFRQGDLGRALSHLREAVALDPNYAEARNDLAAALIQQGAAEEAAIELRRAILLKPESPEAYFNLGMLRLGQGNLERAVVRFREALARRPDYAAAHHGLGLALVKQGGQAEPLSHFRRAAALAPENGDYRYQLGLALAQQGRFAEALPEFRAAADRQPEDPDALYSLGLALANLGRLGEAAEQFKKAVEQQSDHAEALYSWGLALAGQGRFGEAMDLYARALAARPDYAEAHNAWGIALGNLGRLAAAIDHFAKAAALRPGYAEPFNNWGLALVRLGQADAALARFRKAVDLDSAYADAHNNLGIVLARQGKLAEAVESFESALRSQPDHADARANLERTRAAQKAGSAAR
jgi:tetratricopeptide (TPR) repeat protein